MRNCGLLPLKWTIPCPEIESKRVKTNPDPANDSIILAKGATDSRTGGPALEGSGGPDAAGYSWVDSDQTGGPTFAWVDISATGTEAITSGDDVSAGPFEIGFPFTFYCNSFTTFRICSNGFVSFTSSSGSRWNTGLPSQAAPLNLLAPLWDALKVTGAARVYYQLVGGNMVVEWVSVPPYSGTGAHTFEVILTPAGTITFQYLTLGTPTNACTVGIQDGAGTVSLQCAYNAAYLHDNMAIEFTNVLPSPWLRVSPSAGTISPNESMDVTVTIDAHGLAAGIHEGALRVQSNQIGPQDVAVAAILDVRDLSGVSVDGNSDLAEQPLSLSLPNPAMGQVMITFGLLSKAKADLRIYDVQGALVRTLVSQGVSAGVHQTTWDGRTDSGRDAPSGTYFCKLRAENLEVVRRMSLVR